MTLKSPLTVVIEISRELSFADSMSNIRTCLDHNKIQPVSFKANLADKGRRLELEVNFRSEDEAFLFESKFAQP